MKRLLTAIAVATVLVGCSSTVPVNYVPAPSMRGEGAVSVGQFVYMPAQRGDVQANQFQPSPNGALGAMYLSENVDELLKDALVKELIAAGFNPEMRQVCKSQVRLIDLSMIGLALLRWICIWM